MGDWQLDPYHTQVEFSAKHLGMMTVRGHFADVSATGDINPDHPEASSVEVTIKTDSIRTRRRTRRTAAGRRHPEQRVNAMTEPEPGQPGAHAITLARNGELAGQWKLDLQASLAEFRVRHFWRAITVRGSFADVSGDGTVGLDGTASGTLVIAAASLTTNNNSTALAPLATL